MTNSEECPKGTCILYNFTPQEAMPRLRLDARIPISTSAVMQNRIDIISRLNSLDENVLNAWLFSPIMTGDAFVFYPDERTDIITDALPLRRIDAKSRFENGSLVISYETAKRLQGLKLKNEIKKTVLDNQQTIEEVLNNAGQLCLARKPALLKDYTDAFVYLTKMFHQGIDDDEITMGLHSQPDAKKLSPIGYAKDAPDFFRKFPDGSHSGNTETKKGIPYKDYCLLKPVIIGPLGSVYDLKRIRMNSESSNRNYKEIEVIAPAKIYPGRMDMFGQYILGITKETARIFAEQRRNSYNILKR